MKKRFYKITSVLLLVVMLISGMAVLSGCGNSTDTGATAQTAQTTEAVQTAQTAQTAQEQTVTQEKVKIAVIVYSTTDPQQLAINKYFETYLGPQLGIDFIFSEQIADANAEIAYIENASAAGAQGIMAFTSYNRTAALEKCKELKIYYAAPADDAQMLEDQKDNLYFLGGISCGLKSEYDSAKAMVTYFMKNGAKSIGMCTGMPAVVPLFKQRRQGVVDGIAEFEKANNTKITFTEYEGFPGEDGVFFANQAKMIASNPDAIIAAFSGEELWLQPMADAGKSGTIKLGTISAFNDLTKNAVANNQLQYLAAIYPEMFAPNIALLYNAITGFGADFRDNGKAVQVDQEYIAVTSVQEMDAIMALTTGDVPPYTVDDLKSVIKKFNPNATLQDLVNMSMAYKPEDIQKRRAAK